MRTCAPILTTILIGCALLALCAATTFAQPLLMKSIAYQKSVREGDAKGVFLTNDTYESVRQFYKARFVTGTFSLFSKATFETRTGEMGQTGCVYGYMFPWEYSESTGPHSVQVWKFDPAAYKAWVGTLNEPTRLTVDPAMTPPFFYLRTEVQQQRHTQAELDKLIAKYEHVLYTYYRIVAAQDGKKIPERDAIVKRHYDVVFGAESTRPPSAEERQGMDEKKMKETREKMKELKKQGKTAEMMELSMRMQKEMQGTPMGKRMKTQQDSQMKAMMTDNWAEWVKCLEEMDKAGYITKIMITGESEPKQ